MYLYINIRGDSKYSVKAPVSLISSVLNSRIELSQGDNEGNTYVNSSKFSWLLVSIINCDSRGCYPANLSQDSKTANLVEFICRDNGDDKSKMQYMELAKCIAEELKWEAVDVSF